MDKDDCCILNAGGGAWAFDTLARQLSDALWVDVSDSPREYNYLLLADDTTVAACAELFIPFQSLHIAADKRLVDRAFAEHGVPAPQTHLVETLAEAELLLKSSDRQWCLKFPTGCGASGHRMLTENMKLPDGWPRPLVVQEFVVMERPEVFRLYAAGGQLFGWVARRFPSGVSPSPWVAHARGARYELPGEVPAHATDAARRALAATGLLDSFGCADLIRRSDGTWLVLEVGSDGMFNHVDRDLGIASLELEIQRRIANAFWARLGDWRPWGTAEWRPNRVAQAL